MKKLLSIVTALVLMGAIVIPIRAQDTLTETFIGGYDTYLYSIKYPADWNAPQKNGINTQITNADGSIKSSFSYPVMRPGTAKEALDQYTINFEGKADIQELTFEGRDAARLDGPLANRWQIILIIDLGEEKGLVTFEGSQAALTEAETTLLAMAASFHAPPDSDATAENTSVPSATPAAAAVTQSDLGEGATLAIIDGQIGGSTGMGNELYELNIDTKNGKSLKKFGTTSSAYFTQVAWSPDGSQLAFFAIDPLGLTIIDPNGGNSQIVQQVSFIFAWAPDGKQITTTNQNGEDWMISNLGLNGDDRQDVLTIKNMTYIDYIRWSPDGKWLAYVGESAENTSSGQELHIIDATGNNDQVIVPDGTIERYAMWSSDSTQIAYIGQSGAGAGLTTVNIESKATQVVAAEVLAADWSPDGSQFAYATRDGKLFVSNADGTNPQEITRPADLQGQIVAIAWQP